MSSTTRGGGEPRGSGPLADNEPETGRPIDDPALADKANPRWQDPTSPRPDAQPLSNPDGSPNVMPPEESMQAPGAGPGESMDLPRGTDEDPAARSLDPDGGGRDNLREGEGGGASNPALAEGGESG